MPGRMADELSSALSLLPYPMHPAHAISHIAGSYGVSRIRRSGRGRPGHGLLIKVGERSLMAKEVNQEYGLGDYMSSALWTMGELLSPSYEQRKVAMDEVEGATIDTVFTGDTGLYETAIKHPAYDSGDWVIVEEYEEKPAAQAGHVKWVEIMRTLPASLHCVQTGDTHEKAQP